MSTSPNSILPKAEPTQVLSDARLPAGKVKFEQAATSKHEKPSVARETIVSVTAEEDREYLQIELKKLKVLKRIVDARVGELNAENHIFCLRNSCPVKEPSHETGRYQEMFRLQEEARNIAREIDDRTRRYAAAQCLPICTMVGDKLPRELRDMIYQYIIGESIVRIDKEVLASFLFCSEIGVKPILPAGFTNRTTIACEHLWDREYSGKPFYSELIEAWYRNTTFSFVECRLVPDFLNDPRFGYGVPPREWVRKIRIIRITTTESILSIYRGEEKAHNIKTGDLENLKDLPKLTRVIFDFDAAFSSLPTYHDNYRRFVLTDLKEMFPKIQDLLDRECRVSVMFSSMGPIEMRRDELTSRIWEDKLEAIRPD